MESSPILANKTEIKFFSILGLILLALLAITFVIGHRIERKNISAPAEVAKTPNPFEFVHITAKAALVLDARTGKVLFSKNPDTRLPLASLTKVMTALTASELARPESTITVTPEAIATDGDSGLHVWERWSLKNLLDFSLISSSNDGARAVGLALGALSESNATSDEIEADFVRAMNSEADKLGMKNTYYLNDTGLDLDTEKGGAYGTARDMTTLFAYILEHKPELLESTSKAEVHVESESNIVHVAKNTDSIVNSIPGLKGSKTGFTDLAGGNLTVAFDPEIGRPIVIAVLGSTTDGRFDDVTKLVNASLQYVAEGQK